MTSISEQLRDQAKWIEEEPAYEGAEPATLRAAADELDRLHAIFDHRRVPDREVFWLIERVGHGQYVQDRSTRPGLTSDAWRSARFDTEKDAHGFWLCLITLRDECKPVEHMFVNKPGPTSALTSQDGRT